MGRTKKGQSEERGKKKKKTVTGAAYRSFVEERRV